MDSLLTTEEKVTMINRDEKTYGSFAEIGAGQEVARWFFQTRLSSQTIAKTISAYDMTFSDNIYGKEKSGRYVCESRLVKMLDHEYKLIEERLGQKRSHNTKFFAFANTVAAKSYSVTNGYGWLGIRFQKKFLEPPNDLIIHVNLLDPRNLLQQEAIGIVGINLIFGALYFHNDLTQLLKSLIGNLKKDRIEIDMIKCRGPAFSSVDHRLMNLHLVEFDLGQWAVFGPRKQIHQPFEILRGKNILIYNKKNHPQHNRLAMEQFLKDYQLKREDVTAFIAVTLSDTNPKLTDLLSYIDEFNHLGYYILVNRYSHIAQLAERLKQQNIKSSAFVLEMKDLAKLFQNPNQYRSFNGGILEAMGRLFSKNTSLYVHSHQQENKKSSDGTNSSNLSSHSSYYSNAYNYLLKEGKIKDIL